MNGNINNNNTKQPKRESFKTMINDSDSIYQKKREPIQVKKQSNSIADLDLDIDNYEDEELEGFFGLNKGYSVSDIEVKERTMREKMIFAIRNEGSGPNGGSGFDKILAKKIIHFLNEAKEILIDNLKQNPLIVGGGGNSFIIDKPQESITNFIQPVNTFNTDTAPGILNKLRRRTTTMTLAMNTLFRDPNGTSIPSDCVFTLSYTLKNVVSMKLLSIELPEKIYLLSNILQNNVFFVSDTGTGNEALIVIPEGCYDQNSLATAVGNALNNSLSSTNYSVVIDNVSGKTKIANSFNNFQMTFIVPGMSSQTLSKTFGWILGFRKIHYQEKMSFTSEALYGGDSLEYFYFVLDDFNLNYTSNLFAIFHNSYIDKNILAKVPYTNNNNNLTNALTYYDDSLAILSPKRQYFGPVDIKKISIQLLNKYGDVVPLNLMDYSFTLELEMAYDI
jgi:hypothetical protein